MSSAIDQKQFIKLDKILRQIEKTGKNSMFEAIKQTAIFFTISAAKASKPGTKAKPSEMAKKHKFRKIVTLGPQKQHARGAYWYYNPDTNRSFKSKRFLETRQLKRMKLLRVTKFIERFDKKAKRFVLVPWSPFKNKPTEKQLRIPGAGAVKGGWIGSRNRLNGRSGKVGKLNTGISSTKVKKGENPFIEMVNNVHYASKTSKESARIGLRKATNRLKSTYFKKVESDLKKVTK